MSTLRGERKKLEVPLVLRVSTLKGGYPRYSIPQKRFPKLFVPKVDSPKQSRPNYIPIKGFTKQGITVKKPFSPFFCRIASFLP
jgi:hypothetical protein